MPYMLPIVDYVEDTYIGRRARRTRRRPKYPASMCKVYERVLEDAPRTTNSVEGFHIDLQANIL